VKAPVQALLFSSALCPARSTNGQNAEKMAPHCAKLGGILEKAEQNKNSVRSCHGAPCFRNFMAAHQQSKEKALATEKEQIQPCLCQPMDQELRCSFLESGATQPTDLALWLGWFDIRVLFSSA
jgi:hypothetical protein